MQNSNLPATTNGQGVSLRTHLERMTPEFRKALPGHITAERFVRTAQTAIALTRNIDKVKNPQSLLAACTKAAADGLVLDGREAALVVDYNGDVQYRPMMRGLLKLSYQSGDIKSLVVETVRANDNFDYSPTRSAEPIRHEIDLRRPRGEVFAAYALAELKSGGIVFEVMTVEDINRIRDRSDAWKAFKAGKIKSTPWSTDWQEMARKTVFRRLSKYLPSSNEQGTLHQAAERSDEDYSITIDADPADSQVRPVTAPSEPKKRGGAAAALKAVQPQKTPAQNVEREPGDETEIDPETGEIIETREDGMQTGDDI